MGENGTSRYVRSRGMVARKVAGELVLVPTNVRSTRQEHRAADLYVVNASGEFLWSLLASPRSNTEMAQALMGEFDISRQQADQDVAAFLQEMVAIGALERVGD